MTQALTIRT